VAAAQGRSEATVAEESGAERRALYIVAATFFLLAGYITYEAGTALLGQEAPDRSAVGLGLSVLSLVIMPALAWWKQRTGRQMGSRALVADAAETWVCPYLSLALLAGYRLYDQAAVDRLRLIKGAQRAGLGQRLAAVRAELNRLRAWKPTWSGCWSASPTRPVPT
jgi:hypothetical protein